MINLYYYMGGSPYFVLSFFSDFPKIQFIQLLNNKILGDALPFQSHLTFNRVISSTYWFVFFPAFF